MLSAPEAKVDHILAKRPMQHVVIKTFDNWVTQASTAHYPYEKTFEEAAHDPFIVIHTSGSTGLPKPIILRHGGLASVDSHHLMPSLHGYRPLANMKVANGTERMFATLPPFHVSHLGPVSIYANRSHILRWRHR